MANRLKCIGCNQLRQEKHELWGSTKVEIVYTCPLFPYATTIGGLMVPSSGITRAADKCPVDISKGCIICGASDELSTFGDDKIVYICKKVHGHAWRRWLDKHLEKREAFKPRSRIIISVWIEIFREFVEESRQPTQ